MPDLKLGLNTGYWAGGPPPGMPEKMRYRATESGWYFIQVKLAKPGSGSYKIRIKHT